jgi:meso-butanediol dehydrogenase / (S,S)-butanediol dehydrogenase / diacetyl reductase
MRLKDKVVLITGGAQGIGYGIASRLAREGARLSIVDIDLEQAQKAADELERAGAEVIAVRADVADRAQIQTAIKQTVAAFGKLDVMFNNAGFNKPMAFLEITEENWNAIMRVNGLGVLIGTQEAAKQMIKQGGGGKIINTASIAARQGYPDFTPYCASKFAVVAIIQAAARALAKYKITVNGFSPGVVSTPLWDTLDRDLMEMGASSKPGEAIDTFSRDILLGRTAVPDDLGGTGAFLASSDSDYMTGQIIAIDGGMVLV